MKIKIKKIFRKLIKKRKKVDKLEDTKSVESYKTAKTKEDEVESIESYKTAKTEVEEVESIESYKTAKTKEDEVELIKAQKPKKTEIKCVNNDKEKVTCKCCMIL